MDKKLAIYFISGLGADKRAFEKLELLGEYSIKHIDWIEPLSNESLSSYARRLSTAINTHEPFVLVGLSFGGMLAVEISEFLSPLLTILISSVPNRKSLPWYFKVGGYLYLDKIVPARLLKQPTRLLFYLFAANESDTQKLLKQILKDTDAVFLKWAIRKIISWRFNETKNKIFHIHGTADGILPFRFVKADVEIKGGGHLMVFDKAEEVSKILSEKLKNLNN